MTETAAWRAYVGVADSMSDGLKGLAVAVVAVGGLALVSSKARSLISRGDGQCSDSIVMESSSTKSAHRPYLEKDIPDVLGKALSEGLLGLDKEVRFVARCNPWEIENACALNAKQSIFKATLGEDGEPW